MFMNIPQKAQPRRIPKNAQNFCTGPEQRARIHINIDEMDKKTIDFFLLVIRSNEGAHAGNTLLCKVFICIRKYNPIARRLIQSKILCSTKVIYPLK